MIRPEVQHCVQSKAKAIKKTPKDDSAILITSASSVKRLIRALELKPSNMETKRQRPVEAITINLQFAWAWAGLLAPSECPTMETAARARPYGIMMTNYPMATRMTYAANISTLCNIPASSTRISMLRFSRTSISMPGNANFMKGHRFWNVRVVG